MPVEFYEKPKSRKGHVDSTGQTLTRNWFCAGTTDRTEVYELALSHNPSVYEGLLRKSIDVTPLHNDLWDVDVEYGIGKPSGISPDNFAFKIGANSVHINQSRETKLRRRAADNGLPDPGDRPNPDDYPGGESDPSYISDLADYEANVGTAADHKNAIGVSDDAVAGCDIVVPKMEWSKTVQRSEITLTYLLKIFNLVGKTNDAEFYGFPAGSLLYLGAEPTSSEAALADGTEFTVWTLTHQFAYSRDELNVDIGGIKVPKKGGHDFLWVHFGREVAAGPPKRLTQPPDAVYVERVYESGDFEALEIGTSFEGGG